MTVRRLLEWATWGMVPPPSFNGPEPFYTSLDVAEIERGLSIPGTYGRDRIEQVQRVIDGLRSKRVPAGGIHGTHRTTQRAKGGAK